MLANDSSVTPQPAGSHQEVPVVDLDSYPIDRLNSPEGQSLLSRIRGELAQSGCAILRGFVREDLLSRIRQESDELAPQAHINDTQTNPYSSDGDPSLPADHPRNIFMDRSNGFVGGDLIGPGTAIRRLYHDESVKDFLTRVLDIDELYEYADPLGGLVINVLKPGCQHPWHYDTNEFVVSMLTKEPEGGGLFEYCPQIRSPESENYEQVGRVLQGDRTQVHTLQLRPGDLQIFYGRYSLHRVSRVEGEEDRHTVIFSYAREPGMIGRAERTRRIFGRVAPIHEQQASEGPARSDKLQD
ncbi:MAG: HalD/BesD family halogenase [Pseudomonadota bacterium]